MQSSKRNMHKYRLLHKRTYTNRCICIFVICTVFLTLVAGCSSDANAVDNPDDKIILTLATFYGWNIRDAVVQFNTTNTDYYIQIKDYSEFNTEDDWQLKYAYFGFPTNKEAFDVSVREAMSEDYEATTDHNALHTVPLFLPINAPGTPLPDYAEPDIKNLTSDDVAINCIKLQALCHEPPFIGRLISRIFPFIACQYKRLVVLVI